ncbi:hypothetical protein MLD38_011393 [Melastoma candidum]|uniref:Uncharacterized protein n=1 Tax=Melastoma candidum TaxID=119954 RepID=A0ACB9R722_9MYRT|nr:hypothetical protein MLD38_011393 [Melastoma candidum]
MPLSLLLPPPPSLLPHANPLPPSHMSVLRGLTPAAVGSNRLHIRRLRPRSLTVSAAVRQEATTLFTPTPISLIEPAANSSPLLFHIHLDLSDSPELISSHTRPGQYLQLRVPESPKPSFLAIASPPSKAAATGEFEFLVKSVEGSTVEALCGMKKGEVVEVSQAMGKGFEIDRIEPPEEFPTVFVFATGSGISPIRSLIESGFGASQRYDVRLYYGARNLERMAYQDRFNDWESSGVKIIPVLSKPDDGWIGETGYVQAAFSRAEKKFSPLATGAILCGQKQMAEEITSILLADGVSSDKILKNF